MLESIRKGQRWLTLLLVIFIGAVFVLFMGVGGSLSPSTPTGTAIVELGDFRVQMTDYQRLRIRQEEVYRERMGEGFDARTFGPFLDAQTLRTLVESVVLAQSARDLGLGVSREEVQQLVRQSPAFRDESGQFNLDAFRNYAEYEFGNQMNFLESVRQDLLRQKMVGLLYGQATLSDLEAGLLKYRFAFLVSKAHLVKHDIKGWHLGNSSLRRIDDFRLEIQYFKNTFCTGSCFL